MNDQNPSFQPLHGILQDIGDNYLLKIESPYRPRATLQSNVVWIVDRSGSMGISVGIIINRVIPAIMSLDKKIFDVPLFNVITFDDVVESFQGDSSYFNKLAITSRGRTFMSGIFDPLEKILQQQSSHTQIIVISDGDIHDKEQTIARAIALNNNYNNVSVLTVRLHTNQTASPDTQALACVALLNTDGNVDILEWMNPSDVKGLTELIETSLKRGLLFSNQFIVHADLPIFRKFPFSTSTNRIRYTDNLIVDKVADILPSIYIDDRQVVLEIRVLESQDDIEQFIKYAAQWIGLRNIVGAQKENCMALADWFRKLNEWFEKQKTSNESSDDVDLRNRIKQTCNKLRRCEKSIITNLFQNLNQDKLRQLNNNQMADYLRCNVRSVSTARRIDKSDQPTDISHILSTLTSCQSYQPPNYDDDLVSFLSRSNPYESLFTIAQTNLPSCTIQDILPLTGLIGLCIRCKKSDYPDPWLFVVHHVFDSNYYLSESDLCSRQTLQYPATDQPINGVVPLRCFDPYLYDLYYFGDLKNLALNHAGKTLRDIIGIIPDDAIALNMGAFICLLNSLPPNPSTIQSYLIRALDDQLMVHAQHNRSKYTTNLSLDDPRPYMCGFHDCHQILKILFIVIFVHPLNDNQAFHFLHCLFDFESYTNARRYYRNTDNSRSIDLDFLLNINIDSFVSSCPVGEPFEPDIEPSIPSPQHDFSRANNFSWMPDPKFYKSIYRYIVQKNSQKHLSDIFDDTDWESFFYCCAVRALSCPQETDRLDRDNNTAKYPHPRDIQQNINQFNQSISQRYTTNYNERLALKRLQEQQFRINHSINFLINNDLSLDVILSHLNIIADNRNSPGYRLLIDKLCGEALNRNVVQLIEIVLTGRSDGSKVWNEGNVERNRSTLEHFSIKFKESNYCDDWEKIRQCVALNSKHVYRELPNRHGHSNDKPSYFALGFDSLKKYQNACQNNLLGFTVHDWDDYKSTHTNCCGF